LSGRQIDGIGGPHAGGRMQMLGIGRLEVWIGIVGLGRLGNDGIVLIEGSEGSEPLGVGDAEEGLGDAVALAEGGG
jgi:hypothetical protein